MPRQYKACLFDLDGTLIRSTHHFDDVWIRWAGLHGHVPVMELLLLAGGDIRRVPRSFAWPRALMPCLRLQQARSLPEAVQIWWIQCNVKPRIRLGRYVRRARDRLDRPPTEPLGDGTPTRETLIAHLRTAGRRFAREYWTEGLPLFFPGQDLGPVPDEFIAP